MRSALSFLRALLALPALCRALAAEARQTRAALLADGWSPEAADAALRGELP